MLWLVVLMYSLNENTALNNFSDVFFIVSYALNM